MNSYLTQEIEVEISLDETEQFYVHYTGISRTWNYSTDTADIKQKLEKLLVSKLTYAYVDYRYCISGHDCQNTSDVFENTDTIRLVRVTGNRITKKNVPSQVTQGLDFMQINEIRNQIDKKYNDVALQSIKELIPSLKKAIDKGVFVGKDLCELCREKETSIDNELWGVKENA